MDLYKTNRILYCQDMRDDRERAFSAITMPRMHPRTRASKYYELSMRSAECKRLFLRIAISLTRFTVAYAGLYTQAKLISQCTYVTAILFIAVQENPVSSLPKEKHFLFLFS